MHFYAYLGADHSNLDIIGKIFSSCRTWVQMMPILVKGDNVRGGTKANARHGWFMPAVRSQWANKYNKIFLTIKHSMIALWIWVIIISYPCMSNEERVGERSGSCKSRVCILSPWQGLKMEMLNHNCHISRFSTSIWFIEWFLIFFYGNWFLPAMGYSGWI